MQATVPSPSMMQEHKSRLRQWFRCLPLLSVPAHADPTPGLGRPSDGAWCGWLPFTCGSAGDDRSGLLPRRPDLILLVADAPTTEVSGYGEVAREGLNRARHPERWLRRVGALLLANY